MQSAILPKSKVVTVITKSILLLFSLLVIMSIFIGLNPKVKAANTYVWDNRKTVAVVPLEYGPTDYGNPYYWMIEGTRFSMSCYADWKGITGNYYSVRWFRGYEFSRGSWGWVHSSYVINQVPVGRCSGY